MLHLIAINGVGSEAPGLPRVDACACQREAENPQTRDTSKCQCCGGGATATDLWQAEWAYSFTPNKVIGLLAIISAFAGAALIQYTRTIHHSTYHTICADCARRAKRGRVISFMLSYVGLFISMVGLGLSIGCGAWWYVASNLRDRATAENCIAYPIIALVVGTVIVRIAMRYSLPAALRPLMTHPFRSTALRQFHQT